MLLLTSCGPVNDGYMDSVSYKVGDSLKLYLDGRNANEEFQIVIRDILGEPIQT